MQSAFDCLSDIENARHSKRPGGGKKREPGSPVASRTPFDRLRVLLEHHKLPDVAIDQYRDSEGKTLLIAAAAAGHEEVVEYLLKRGASPNETDDKGWTALMCSVAFCKPKVCMILLSEPDIDVNISHGGGGTALFLAAHSGLGDVVNRLIELGADIHKSNIAGFTPVMMAVDGGNPDIAKVLIDAGAVVDNADNLIGITALHLSVYIGDDASAEKILVHLSGDTGQKMTCINRRTKFGLSALHRAVASGHLTTVRLDNLVTHARSNR
jgi:ankyrin repeat protein